MYLRFDKKKHRPFLACEVCGSHCFLRTPQALTGLAIVTPLIEEMHRRMHADAGYAEEQRQAIVAFQLELLAAMQVADGVGGRDGDRRDVSRHARTIHQEEGLIMRTSFPNRPFLSALSALGEPRITSPVPPSIAETGTPPPAVTSVSEVVTASDKRRLDMLAALDAERARREWLEYDAFAEAARVENENRMIDEYDAGAKLHRGQGNRKFVVHFAAAACVTMVALVGIDAILSAARAQ